MYASLRKVTTFSLKNEQESGERERHAHCFVVFFFYLPSQVHNNEKNNDSHQSNCCRSYTSNQANLFNCVSFAYDACYNDGPEKREERRRGEKRRESQNYTPKEEEVRHIQMRGLLTVDR